MLNKIIYTILGFSLAFVFFPRGAQDSVKKPMVSGVSTSQERSVSKAAPEMAINLSAPIITGKSALAFDLSSGVILYSKNLDEKLPIASLTKLMTAIVVVKHAKFDDVVKVKTPGDQVTGSTIGLVAGENITVHNLLRAMLIPSSNDSALALAEYISGTPEKFADLMNEEAKNLNLADTSYSNPVGWDSAQNYSNASDLIKIVQEFLKHKELAEIVGTKETVIGSQDNKFSHQLKTTNQLLLDDPRVIGIKTGFTSQAKGNLIIMANQNNNKIVTIVLGSDNREEDTRKLLDWLFTAYRW